MPSVLQVKSNLETSAKTAIESKDYLSYAQVIDQNLSPASDFDDEEAAKALDCLADVLDTKGYEELCFHIGWDIPELMMLYVEEFSPGSSGDPNPNILKALSKLGNVICLKSNPREFFLKVCELMRDVDFSEAEDLDLDNEDADLKANTRFCLLFEMLRYSLNRILTPYPTRFIKMANSILLEVANSRTSITGVITVLRRIFIFARDFDMNLTEASEEEQSVTRRLLVSLLTYGADVSLKKFSLKLTERLYYQMTNKLINCSDPTVRSSSYNLSLYTARLEDALTRCSQLALSYDMDPMVNFMNYILEDDTTPVCSYDLRPKGDDNATLDYLLTPSLLGTFFMYSQLDFIATKPPSRCGLPTAVKMAIYCRKHCPMTAGMRDAMLYWALNNVANMTPETIAKVENEDFSQYVKVILSVAGESPILNERCIAFCIVGKVLGKLAPDVSVGIMLDTIETSPYPHILDAGVQILKSVMLGIKEKTKKTCFIKDFVGMSIKGPQVSQELKTKVALTAEQAADNIIAGKAPLSSYIMSWINLLHVVETDPQVVTRLRTKLSKYLEDKSNCSNSQVVKVALDNLSTTPKTACPLTKRSRAVA